MFTTTHTLSLQVPVHATLCENQTNKESLKRERMLEARVIRDQTLPNDRVSRRYLPISEAAHHDNDAQEHGEHFTSMITSGAFFIIHFFFLIVLGCDLCFKLFYIFACF